MYNELKIPVNYGLLIRLNRINQNLNLSTLAELSGISISQLSKIERGFETATDEVLGCVFEALDINFKDIKEEIDEIQICFWEFYRSIVYVDAQNSITNKFDQINNKYGSNFLTVEIVLINMLYYLTYNKNINKADECITLINQVYDYLDTTSKQIFLDYYGVYYKLINRIDKSIYYHNLALEINNSKMISAMIYYHLGTSYRKNKLVLNAFQALLQAKELFLASNNYIRSCMTDFSIANIHSTNGEYDKALQLHKKCIEIYKRMNIFSNEISKIYLNMIWINILIDHYSEALEIIENLEDDILECLKNRDEFKLYKIIVFLHFGRNDEAFELCKDIKRNYKKDNIAHNFIMYYYHINGTKNIRMKYLNNINILVAQSTNYSTYRLLFKLLRNECTSEKQLAEFNDLMYQYIFNLFN